MNDIIERVTEAMEAAVKERGENYTYPKDPEYWYGDSCVYQLGDGTPACIIGTVARKLNPDIDMSAYNEQPDSVTLRALGVSRLPGPLVTALYVAQSTQDGGSTWGESLTRFHEELADF